MYPKSIGPYRLMEFLGAGGMAEVFLAEKSGAMGLSKKLVLKRILPHLKDDPELQRLFVREASISLQLQHPNLIQVYDFASIDDELVLVMEYVRGVDLDRLGPGLSPDLIIALGKEVLEGLRYLHENGTACILHQDISPGNILIDAGGNVRLLDFGLSRVRRKMERTVKTRPRATWSYASPERKSGGELTPADDIYSLGLVLLEALSGTRMGNGESGENPEQVLAALGEIESSPVLEELSTWLSDKADKRPQSARDAIKRLEQLTEMDRGSAGRRLADIVQQQLKNVEGTGRRTRPAEEIASVRGPLSFRRSLILTALLLLAAVTVYFWLVPLEIEVQQDPDPGEFIEDRYRISALLPIDCKPQCTIIIDGRSYGRSPIRVLLAPGRHEILFTKPGDGAEIAKRAVYLKPGANAEIYKRFD